MSSADDAMLANVLLRFKNWSYTQGADVPSVGAHARSLSARARPSLRPEVLRSDAVVARLLGALAALPPKDGMLAQTLREQLVAVLEAEPATAEGLFSDTVLAVLDGTIDG